MAKLILIRHGETQWNRERRMQGHSDSPLSEVGLRQAQALAQRMKNFEFHALYCSDSGRAHHTARAVAVCTIGWPSSRDGNTAPCPMSTRLAARKS